MGRNRRPGNPAKNKDHKKQCIKRTYKRDVDQIVFEDMLPQNTARLLNQPLQEDMPGLGQHYCIACARYFITEAAIKEHHKTKEHKKRFKIITTEKPYTAEEAERAAGLLPAVKRPYAAPVIVA